MLWSNYPAPCTALAVDTEKAFGRVSWPFLLKTLDKFGFGLNFIRWIQLLYTAPQSMVTFSAPFCVKHRTTGTVIRDDAMIKGIEICNETHKTLLYADDVLVYVSDPLNSIPNLMGCFAKLGSLSGYKVNVNKTEALALNSLTTHQIIAAFSFKWPKEGISYLGTTITPNLDRLYKANYNKLISADLTRWAVLPLSISGRI